VLRILALEPYYGGSHRAFLDGWRAHSRHSFRTLTMPARKWKWRMRGAAITMGELLREGDGDFDLLFVSDFVDLAALVGLQPALLAGRPRIAYFHENQLTYPVSETDERDYQYAFTNLTTCLAADRVLFNSRYHMESFLAAAARLLAKMPDFVPDWAPDRIRARSQVLPVGVDLDAIDRCRSDAPPRTGPLTVLWNHRWEYDKGADEFFDLMMELDAEAREFRLVVTGESFRTAPAVFEQARRRLAGRLAHLGYVRSHSDYCRLLCECDVVVSTAIHEFFGIAVVEAVYAGCAPLLPDRLSYPELLPPDAHAACLYRDRADLKARLVRWIEDPQQARALDLRDAVRRFGWDEVAPRIDAAAEQTCGGGHD
jgi:glycosyltransferase involved in cell wall biosynthesis